MKKQVLKRISEFIAALTALLLLVPFCACAAPTGGTESQEPTEAISAAPETAGIIEDFSMEESIRSGVPERIDYKLLLNDGIRIDVDGDGVKETITASNVEGGSGDMLHLKLNGKDTNILVENGASVWFVSLLGSSIQIAEEERFPASRMGIYFNWYMQAQGSAGLYEEGCDSLCIRCIEADAGIRPGDCSAMEIPGCGIGDLKVHARIEDFFDDGALIGPGFALLGSTDENYDTSYLIDIDGDGGKEEMIIKAGRVLVYEKGLTDEPSFEVPYLPEGANGTDPYAIAEHYRSEGYDAYLYECSDVYVNGVKFISGAEHADGIPYVIDMWFSKAPNGGVMLIGLSGNFFTLEWQDGEFIYNMIASGEN